MIDNQDVAVLTKVNELAERRGFKAYDFVATFKMGTDDDYILTFELPAQGNGLREERWDKMLKDIGSDTFETGQLKGSPATVIDALDNAIKISPRKRIT